MSDTIIQIKDVNKWFGDFQVLKDINLTIKKGEKIDGIGGFTTYGVTYPVANTDSLIPLGLLEGSTVVKEIKKGDPITKDSVDLPENLINSLRKLQEAS